MKKYLNGKIDIFYEKIDKMEKGKLDKLMKLKMKNIEIYISKKNNYNFRHFKIFILLGIIIFYGLIIYISILMK